MSPLIQWVVGVLGAGGFGKLTWDVVTAFSQSRKTKTDNAVTLINSATGYNESLIRRLDTMSDKFDDFRKEQNALNKENDQRWRTQERLLLAHSQWDHQMVLQLRTKGVRVEDPPPLFLPEGITP